MSRSYFANARLNPIENNAQVRDDRRYRYPDKPEPTMRHLRPARSLPARLTTPTLQLLEGVQTMEESTTYQTILGEGRAGEAQRLLILQGEIRPPEATPDGLDGDNQRETGDAALMANSRRPIACRRQAAGVVCRSSMIELGEGRRNRRDNADHVGQCGPDSQRFSDLPPPAMQEFALVRPRAQC